MNFCSPKKIIFLCHPAKDYILRWVISPLQGYNLNNQILRIRFACKFIILSKSRRCADYTLFRRIANALFAVYMRLDSVLINYLIIQPASYFLRLQMKLRGYIKTSCIGRNNAGTGIAVGPSRKINRVCQVVNTG